VRDRVADLLKTAPEGERLRIVHRLLTLGTRRIADFQDGWGLATLMELQ